MKTEEDFYDLMYAYLRRASVDNVFVAEVLFEPKAHTDRGVLFADIVNGLYKAIVNGFINFGIRACLIMRLFPGESETDAVKVLEEARPFLDKIAGLSFELADGDNSPNKFKEVYKLADEMGLKVVAHVGEETSEKCIEEALDLFKFQRINCDIHCFQSTNMTTRLVDSKVPLSTCLLSNQKLQVLSRFFTGRDLTKDVLSKNPVVTISSDFPAYFGGYITDNFLHAASVGEINEVDVNLICRNAFQSAFVSTLDKAGYLKKIDKFNVEIGCAAPPKSIAFFGSRKPQPGSKEYEDCADAAKLMSSNGYSVVHGGSGGLMEAASRGCYEGAKERQKENGNPLVTSVGVVAPRVFNSPLAAGNSFVTKAKMARNLVERLGCITEDSEYYFVCSGTIGTITELFVAWNIASVRPMSGCLFPKLFVLRSFWEKTLKDVMATVGIYEEDCGLVTFVDTKEDLLKLVEDDWKIRKDNSIL